VGVGPEHGEIKWNHTPALQHQEKSNYFLIGLIKFDWTHKVK